LCFCVVELKERCVESMTTILSTVEGSVAK